HRSRHLILCPRSKPSPDKLPLEQHACRQQRDRKGTQDNWVRYAPETESPQEETASANPVKDALEQHALMIVERPLRIFEKTNIAAARRDRLAARWADPIFHERPSNRSLRPGHRASASFPECPAT